MRLVLTPHTMRLLTSGPKVKTCNRLIEAVDSYLMVCPPERCDPPQNVACRSQEDRGGPKSAMGKMA